MLIKWLNNDVFFISLLFNIVSRLKHFQLQPFMLNKVNVTLLRPLIVVYCLCMLIIWFYHDAFFISLLFRIAS